MPRRSGQRPAERMETMLMTREMIGPMPKMEAESLLRGFKAEDTWKLENDLEWFEWNLEHHDPAQSSPVTAKKTGA